METPTKLAPQGGDGFRTLEMVSDLQSSESEPLPERKLASSPKDELSTGPRYTRTSLHASGGAGHVWLARDSSIGRDVALKELRSANSVSQHRFLREAKITGQLEHPGVVPVYELGRDPVTERPFYVMRFIRGRTLSEVATAFHRNRRPGWHESMELVNLLTAFVSVCNTIAFAHSRGIVHRDLKGENIIVGEFGEVIVLDWGLAKRLNEEEDTFPTEELDPVAHASRTLMGQVVGTPAYMAPEQARGQLDLIGPPTDIFGLGAILYEILTGRPPFFGEDVTEVILQATSGVIVPPHEKWPEVPIGLEAACLKALSKEPANRFSTALALGQEVQGWQDRQRRHAEDELRQAFDRLRTQQSALVALTRTEVFSSPDLSAIFRRLIEVAARTLGVERVSIWRFTPNRKTLHCHALFELSLGRHSAGVELSADAYPNYFAALAATDVIDADDAQQDPRTREFTEGYLVPLNIGAMMEVPIHPDGVLCHEHVGASRQWLPDEQLFGIAVGNLAAHAISHWERRQALEQLGLGRDDSPLE